MAALGFYTKAALIPAVLLGVEICLLRDSAAGAWRRNAAVLGDGSRSADSAQRVAGEPRSRPGGFRDRLVDRDLPRIDALEQLAQAAFELVDLAARQPELNTVTLDSHPFGRIEVLRGGSPP